MSAFPVFDRVSEPALVCRKCDRLLVGGTLPVRFTLCQPCGMSDSRPRVTSYHRRSRRRRVLDHVLDRWLPVLLMVAGVLIGSASLGYMAYTWLRLR